MTDALERLKILINSSTPIVVIETVEEMRVVRLVRAACSSMNLATFEWSIASGLVRCGSDVGEFIPEPGRLSASGHGATETGAQAIYNSREPAQALSNLEAMSLEAAFVLEDFHRHMDDPVVVRRLREVGQKFSQTGAQSSSLRLRLRSRRNWAAWSSFWNSLCLTSSACVRSSMRWRLG